MKHIRSLLILLTFLLCVPLGALAQGKEVSVQPPAEEDLSLTYTEIGERMMLFQEELNQLYTLSRFQVNIDLEMPLTESLLDVVGKRIQSLKGSYNSFETRWTTYSQAQQVYVADNDTLLNKMAQIQQMSQMVNDTLTLRQQQFDQLSAFTKAETFIWGHDKQYRKLYKQAVQYSMSPKLAPQLEKVKAEEANIFADAQNSYNQAKQAAETFPGLKIRMQGLEKKFNELQSVSAKIQEMAYKPIIQRIKDYLLGLAAVAILMMFFNLLTQKLKTLKQAREQAKKLKESMQGQHDYPTI